MKTFIILLITVINTSTSTAQIPNYFDDNPSWICEEKKSGLWGPGCYSVDNYLYYTEGDTIIGSYTYKKIKRKGWTSLDGACWTGVKTYYDDGYCFGFRQDGRKVYINDSGVDSLYVDYNLNIGDTLSKCYLLPYQPSIPFTVISIDSALISSGYHRIFEFEYTEFDTIPFYLYEGIGIFSASSQSGLFNLAAIINQPFEWWNYLCCYFQNGTIEFENVGIGHLPFDLTLFDFTVGIEKLDLPDKQLIKVCDLLGKETNRRTGTTLIYYYSDGTIERKMILE